ncbi:pilin N-terminal domain-containing protein [Lactococcus cremoris]
MGNELSVVSGIHYLVYEISPTGVGSGLTATNPSQTSYTISKEIADLVTDSNGVASLSVSEGYYLIEEQSNPQKGLLKPALPLVVKLPVSGLNNVYIYPKSSVDEEEH